MSPGRMSSREITGNLQVAGQKYQKQGVVHKIEDVEPTSSCDGPVSHKSEKNERSFCPMRVPDEKEQE